MTDDAIAREAVERRDGLRTLSLQLEDVRTEVGSMRGELTKVSKGLRVLKRKANQDIEALVGSMEKLNRRALAIALAAVLAAVGSIPEARALAAAIAKGLMH